MGGAHLQQRQRSIPAPPQRGQWPLTHRHGHAGEARPPRPPRVTARLRPAGGGGHHVAGHGVGHRKQHRPTPQHWRSLPPRQREVPPLNAGVSVDDNVSSMMYWVVEPMPSRDDMPSLRAPPPNTPYGYLLGVIHSEPGWLIRFVRALNEGHYPKDPEADGWQQFWFRWRSAFRLRDDLGFLVSAGVYYRNTLL